MNFNKNQIILFGFFFHLLAAIFSIGYHHCDELFQVYEFAGYKLGINPISDLPWEFNEQMRSGIQPLIVFYITKFCYAFSVTNPFGIAMLVRILQSLLSFIAVVKLLNLLDEEIINQRAKIWLWWFGLLFWCLPYFHARFSSENFSSTLFIFGLVLVIKTKTSWLQLFSAGVLFGFAFLARFQICFMLIGLFAWLIFINKTSFKLIFISIIGMFVALGIGLIIDHWLYDRWLFSWWNYLDLNLFKDKASAFGKQPIYFYLSESFLQLIPPFSLIFIVSVLLFWYRFKTHVITWITLPFVVLHLLVSHKELRFLFPMLNFLPFMVLYYFQSAALTKNKVLDFLNKRSFLRVCMVINVLALLLFTFKPADNISFSLKKIHDLTEGPHPVLLYHDSDPYNNMAALNYFRKPTLVTIPIDSMEMDSNELYYFSEKFYGPAQLTINDKTFSKVYSNFPAWFSHLNFNGWLDRSFCFSIYKADKIGHS